VGFPNAGKSTLLNTLSFTQVKTANYHFTTLQPNLGFIQCEDYSRIYLADIPGIIENAHQNKGLGLAFLRHIERTHVLLFVIDSSQVEREDPFQDFLILRKELLEYSPALLEKPFIVVLNKTDIADSELSIINFKKNYPFPLETLFEISCTTRHGIPALTKAIEKIIANHTASIKTSFSANIS
jgi:GTP-binding protein